MAWAPPEATQEEWVPPESVEWIPPEALEQAETPGAALETASALLAGTEEFFASGGQPEQSLARFLKPAESLRPPIADEGLPVGNPDAYHTPLVHIPTPEVIGPGTGALRGAANLAEGLTSPMNLALLPLLGGAPGIIKAGAGLGFGVPMAKHAISETLPAALDATTPGEATQKLVEGIGELGLATGIVAHRPRAPIATPAEAKLVAEAATKIPEAPVPQTPLQAKSLASLGFEPDVVPREPIQPPRPAPVETPPRRFATRPPQDIFGSESTPVSAAIINDIGGIVSKSQAKKVGKYDRNGELWDDAPGLKHPTHNKVYNTKGEMPDAAAQTLYDAGLIADPSVGTMWKALAAESQTARVTAREARVQVADEKLVQKQGTAFEKAAADKDAPAVEVKDLNVGDVVTVGSEPMKVTEINPDTFDVTLEDGKKFGIQEVKDGEVIYGEHVALPQPAESGLLFSPSNEAAKSNTPTLRQGENQGDLLAKQQEDLTLVGEKGVDYARKQAEQQAAQVAASEARAIQERQQQRLFTEQQAIPKALRSDPELVRLLEGEPVGPQMKAPAVSEEGGFIFGKPAPKVVPKGSTPKGDTEFLRIPTALKRVFHGLEREGAADVIGRTKNKVGQVLSKAIKRHVDTEQELFGQMYSKFEAALKGISSGKQEKAFDELQQYFADKENGRPVPAISGEAQKILKAWETIADETGTIATAHNVQVFDPKLGGHRPMHKIGKDYFPRVFRPEVQRVMRDPQANPGLWNALVDSVATHKGIAPDEAANYLRGEAGRFQANDFMGNLEMARSEQLPEIFYDYDLRQVAARYIPSFSDRMSQIIAYGQRLGPRDAPQRQNLWDIARGEAENDYTQKWIRSAEDQAVNLHPNSASARVAVRAQTLANALLLSNPVTTVPRNFISGIAATGELLGVVRSVKPFAKMVTSAQSRVDAREIGAVRDRMADFLHADQLGESFIDDAVRSVTSKALKYSGYNGSEVFVRAHGSLTAQQFAHDAVAAINKNPASRQSREALALFKRMDVDAKQLVAEKADWKTGEETRKFIRTVIRDTQGGYRFDQVPLWANSPVGRFFYQFGRYGTQRSRNIWKNAIKPALGEEVEWNGKTMSVYNPKPLLKMGVGAIAAGEVFAGIAALAFDKDRKDASIKEIRETLAEDTKAGIALALERALNDVIMAGTLGIWSQPIDFAKQLKDQSRFKNPAEPPSLASVRALIDLTTNAIDQGGKLTTKDMIRFGGSFAPGVKQVTDVARNVFDEPLYEAQNDVRTLRTAGMRWAKTAGLDATKMAGKFRKSGNAPVYESVQEALLVGNADAARVKAREFLVEQKTRAAKEKAMKSLRSSVNSRQPFRVGPYTSDEHRADFMRWAQQHLPEADYLQAKRIQERYERAAREAGLMN